MADPTEGDRIAYIAISLYGDGSLSVTGNIADMVMAKQMLAQAADALMADWTRKHGSAIFVPNRDVEVTPTLPLVPHGDVPPELRAVLSKEGVKL
jgi:hypothetical protein